MSSLPTDVPTRLGEYEVLRAIGHGPNGFVCLVRGPEQRDLAAKVLHPRYAGDEQRVTRFEKEAHIARSLSHPHIIRVHRVVSHSNYPTPFYLMDYLSGGHFGQFRGVCTAQVLGLLADVCDALDYLHLKRLVHFDVKPTNILLAADTTVYLSDFGTVAGAGGPPPGGTLSYMSPEQYAAESPDARTDIYSAGVVLYEVAIGELPFTASNPFSLQYQIQHSDGPPRIGRAVAVPDGVGEILRRAMASRPDERFPTAAAMAAALRGAAANG